MTKYRIKAYLMHEHEQEAAKTAVATSVIAEAEWTPGYVMGVVAEPKIESLSKQGLVISLIEEVAPTEEETISDGAFAAMPVRMALPGTFALNRSLAMADEDRGARPLPVTTENWVPKSKILSHDPRRTQFYVVRFHGSITEERRRELRKHHIKLIERLSSNKYTVKLKPSQTKTLAEMPFVDCLRLYTEGDTLRVRDSGDIPQADDSSAIPVAATTLRAGKTESTRRTCVYSVKLHQAKDMPALVKWLAGKKHKPLWKHRDYLQVALLENSKTLTDLAKRPEVAIVEQVEAPRLYDGPARTLLGLVRNNSKLGLEGAGEIIGVADTGIDKTHADLKNRIVGVSAWGRKGDVSDPEGHGTHVAGCAVGDGTASKGEVMGAAPQARFSSSRFLIAMGSWEDSEKA